VNTIILRDVNNRVMTVTIALSPSLLIPDVAYLSYCMEIALIDLSDDGPCIAAFSRFGSFINGTFDPLTRRATILGFLLIDVRSDDKGR